MKKIAFAAPLLLLLAACGMADNTGPTDPPDPVVVTETVTAEPEVVTETVTAEPEVVVETVTVEPTKSEADNTAQMAPPDAFEADAAEVTVDSCYYDANWVGIIADVSVTNTGDVATDISGMVEVTVDGNRIDELSFYANVVSPGQTVFEQAAGFNEDVPTDGFDCTVLYVDQY